MVEGEWFTGQLTQKSMEFMMNDLNSFTNGVDGYTMEDGVYYDVDTGTYWGILNGYDASRFYTVLENGILTFFGRSVKELVEVFRGEDIFFVENSEESVSIPLTDLTYLKRN